MHARQGSDQAMYFWVDCPSKYLIDFKLGEYLFFLA